VNSKEEIEVDGQEYRGCRTIKIGKRIEDGEEQKTEHNTKRERMRTEKLDS
jgi:hypothetical protein